MSFDREVTGMDPVGEPMARMPSVAWRKRRTARRLRATDDTDFHPAVVDAVTSARTFLMRQQEIDEGNWRGMLATDFHATAEYLLLLQWLGLGRSERATNLRRCLRDAFDAEAGGWGNGSRNLDLNVSILAYLALKFGAAATPPSPDRDGSLEVPFEHLQLACETIRRMGGANGANGITRFFLAMFNAGSFQRCPLLPPEFVLLPRWTPFNIYRWSRWARSVVLPLSVIWALRPTIVSEPSVDLHELYLNSEDEQPFKPIASVGAGSLRARCWKVGAKGAAWLVRAVERSGLHPFRRHALRKAESWMTERIDAKNGMIGSMTATVLTAVAFKALGHPADSAPVSACLDALDGAVVGFRKNNSDGTHAASCPEELSAGISSGSVATQDTAAVMQALTISGIDAHSVELRRGVEWLLQAESSRVGDWNHVVRAEPGGWSREFPSEYYPHVVATARVLQTLREPFANNPPSSLTTDDSMVAMIRANSLNLARRQVAVLDRVAAASRRARRWLLAMQHSDGGWPYADRQATRAVLYSPRFSARIPMHDMSTPESTGYVLQALGSWEMGCGQSAIDRAVSYLRQKQSDDGRWVAMHDGCDLRATANSLIGLRSVGISCRDMTIHSAARWLLSQQRPDGGWLAEGRLLGGQPIREDSARDADGQLASCPLQTAVVLLALEQAGLGHDDAVNRAVSLLTETQDSNGCWQPTIEPQATTNLVHSESTLSYTALPLLALARWGLQASQQQNRTASVG